jgi:hypothetical protein
LESIVIGRDGDIETTAPVVVPVEGATRAAQTPNQARLPKAAQTTLRALTEALDEQGKPSPASNHIPSNVKVVDAAIWRQQAYRPGISTSNEERARQMAFKRASEHLIGSGRVGMWDSAVWLATGG